MFTHPENILITETYNKIKSHYTNNYTKKYSETIFRFSIIESKYFNKIKLLLPYELYET